MNILVLGNGFDLAHNLPTKYEHFLEWVVAEKDFFEKLKRQGSSITKDISKVDLTIPENRQKKYDIGRRVPHQKEVWTNIEKNVWLEYFLQCDMYQKENWIDFESEIKRVIRSIENDMKAQKADTHYNIKNFTETFFQKKFIKDKSENITYGRLINTLYNDLMRLIRALEIYLAEYIEIEKCDVYSPDISDETFDAIISFNYTYTFSKLYDKNHKLKYDYIHGKAKANNNLDTNNMVLGIDEDDSNILDVDRNIDFIGFKKYFQRIFKATGNDYKIWIEEIKKQEEEYNDRKVMYKEKLKDAYTQILADSHVYKRELKTLEEEKIKHHVYFFGHSMDITDRDIIRDLILNDTVYVTIYYYAEKENDRSELFKKIANLVKVIGSDELIKRTGGSTKTIEFVLQREMVKKN